MKPAMAAVLACVFSTAWHVPAQSTVTRMKPEMTGVVVPVYLRAPTRLAGVIRIGRVFPDHQRRGFFRLGVLPMVVAEEVTIELTAREGIVEGLKAAEVSLQPLAGGRALELREVTLSFPAEPARVLSARRVRPGREGRWELEEVHLEGFGPERRCARATLQLTGPQAGRLTWPAREVSPALDLFSDRDPTTLNHESASEDPTHRHRSGRSAVLFPDRAPAIGGRAGGAGPRVPRGE